jgi:hypothetical protein
MARRAVQFMAFPDTVVPLVDLRQLLDFAELVHLGGSGIDWERMAADAESVSCRRQFLQWGFLANRLMGTAVPPVAARPCVIPTEVRTPTALPRHLIRLGLQALGVWDPIDRWRAS